MDKRNSLLYIAIITALALHGSSLFFTIEKTYDALIHLFFADHYAKSWFDAWEPRWYTGFTLQSYPPLVHQLIGILSLVGGLKFGMFTVGFLGIILFVTGIYRFALLLFGDKGIAGYSAILCVFSTTFIETLHLFGQLPSIMGFSILLHSMPEIYLWIKTGKILRLITSISLVAVTVTSHHVTPIFGMIFFIFPLMGTAVMDMSRDMVSSFKEVHLIHFWKAFKTAFWRVCITGGSVLCLIVFCILPYWVNSKKNPITQVAIPHGSRDNFLEVTSSGLVFFLIPWGAFLLILPYIFYRLFHKRLIFFGLSVSVLFILGTGGTTPIPVMMLGEHAFNILTLDRFTLWACIISTPFMGEFVYRLGEADLKIWFQEKLGKMYHRIVGGFIAIVLLYGVVFTFSIGYFRPTQPEQINMLPIINFLYADSHDEWRYLTLGFGDQMAWLSAQTKAETVDGNYHSARRLPELTSRAVERLENSKFRGVEGLGSLQQFLTVPEKFHLKYIFSNDKFYDPLLFFCGWQRTVQLENGIMVWERLGVAPLPEVVSRDPSSKILNIMWGVIPLLTILMAFIINIQRLWVRALFKKKSSENEWKYKLPYNKFSTPLVIVNHIWIVVLLTVIGLGVRHFQKANQHQLNPTQVIAAYYDALDFKEFERAHSYLHPDKRPDMALFMQQISVTDGLLSSYAKVESILTEEVEHWDNFVKVKTNVEWVTPIKVVQREIWHTVEKIDGEWFIEPTKSITSLPPDQFYSNNSTTFFSHGRRKITTQATNHEDVMKQPVVEILSATLVAHDNDYYIIGEIQNVDNMPADVNLKATLYNKENVELTSYNARFMLKHRIMPKETSTFRIEFEGVAWVQANESKPETFDPEQFTHIDWESEPVEFNLHCEANVASKDLYKGMCIQECMVQDSIVEGVLFNGGLQEVTLPQLLVSYYDENFTPIWLENVFVLESVRVHRKQPFSFTIPEYDDLVVIKSSVENCFINGLPNEYASSKLMPSRASVDVSKRLQKVNSESFSYMRIEPNNFIGNPK